MKRQTIASVCLYLVSAVALLFGVMYLYKSFTAGLMPYHIKFIGKTCADLPANECFLFRTFMRIIGFCFTAIGISNILLVRKLFNGLQDKFDWTLILVMMLLSLVPLLPITLSVGSYTPWYAVAITIVLWVVGLVLAYPRKTT